MIERFRTADSMASSYPDKDERKGGYDSRNADIDLYQIVKGPVMTAPSNRQHSPSLRSPNAAALTPPRQHARHRIRCFDQLARIAPTPLRFGNAARLCARNWLREEMTSLQVAVSQESLSIFRSKPAVMERLPFAGLMMIANQCESPARVPMSNVIPFRRRDTAQDEAPDIDLLTAVDVAIRDLQDISQGCGDSVYAQVMQCRQMLERTFNAAVQS